MMNKKLLHIQDLKNGKTIQIRCHGNSMVPKIRSGELITLAPIKRELKVGDIVFCKVKRNTFVHLITATRGKQYQISNNHGYVNGWITKNAIFGIVIRVEK